MKYAGRVSRIAVALIDDYDVVVVGLAQLLEPYREHIDVIEIDANEPLRDTVDIALYDSFAQPEADHDDIDVLIDSGHAKRVVVYTWNFHPELVAHAQRKGAHGYLSKALTARELVAALQAVHAGEIVVSPPPSRAATAPGLDWPGRREGLTEREAEILALITQGTSNADIAAVTHRSPNTIKSQIRAVYRKIGTTSRSQAVLWGVHHGFTPDHDRIEHWRGN